MFLKNLLLTSSTLLLSTGVMAADCSEQVIKLLKENKPGETIKLNCSAKLTSKDVITKTVVFEGKSGSNITLDCNGAKIVGTESTDIVKISSKVLNKDTLSFERPENITIKNCHIQGSMRIIGMGVNGEAALVNASSRLDNKHTARAQAAAPTNIILSNMTFEGKKRIPLYLSPGVTKVTVQDSVFKGNTSGTALYMDAESGYNKIIRNNFDTFRESREMIAVDASANNIISGNQFHQAKHGVIYLYRNCGEGKTVRIQTPSNNQIVGNWFPTAASDKRLIINSRSGDRNYCNDDSGLSYGSSTNNLDNGVENIVAGNYFKGKKVGIVQNENNKNYIFGNKSDYQSKFTKVVWCATKDKILKHGEKTSVYTSNKNTCELESSICDQGEIKVKKEACPDHKIVNAVCSISGNNKGCSTTAKCPVGYKIFKAKAVCNLETESLSQSLIDDLALGQVLVARKSDKASNGKCTMDKTSIESGSKSVSSYPKDSINFSCKEYDKNGGDCKILGQIICQKE